jgi:hypothetical protein
MQTGVGVFARLLYRIRSKGCVPREPSCFRPQGCSGRGLRPPPGGSRCSGVFPPARTQTGVFSPAGFPSSRPSVTGVGSGGAFARASQPLPAFARIPIPPRTTPQPSSWHRGERARFSVAFPGRRGWGSRACSSHPCVPPAYLACTSCRRQAKGKRFRDRLYTATVLAVNLRTG